MTQERQQEYLSDLDAAVTKLHNKLVDQDAAQWQIDRQVRALFMESLPSMTSRRSVQLYISAVAMGFSKGHVDRDTMKSCLHAAQLALAAFGSTGDPPPALAMAKKGFV